MNLKSVTIIFSAVFTVLAVTSAFSAEGDEQVKPKIGYAVDLLPTALSATEGKAGYSFQTWGGYDHIKIRLVAAHFYMPQSQVDSSFENYEVNVTAFLIDWFPYGDLSGFWFGAGTELWNSRIEHKDSGSKSAWTDNILTAGIGYVWKITDNIYVDPFAAVHYRMSDGKIETGCAEFERMRVSASASVKIGYQFSL